MFQQFWKLLLEELEYHVSETANAEGRTVMGWRERKEVSSVADTGKARVASVSDVYMWSSGAILRSLIYVFSFNIKNGMMSMVYSSSCSQENRHPEFKQHPNPLGSLLLKTS